MELTRRALLGSSAAVAVAASITTVGAESASAATITPQVRTAASTTARIASFPTGYSLGSDVLFQTTAEVDQTLDSLLAAQVTHVRIDCMWYWLQPTATTWDFTRLDYIVAGALSRGLSILGILLSCPPWASVNASSGTASTRPKTAALYATFASTVAKRYKGKIFAYEIWNEPNGREFFAPNPDAAFYTSMLKAAYPVIKSADPAAQVIAGALGPAPTGDGTLNSLTFMNTMYANGAQGYFDAFSFHPYDADDDFSAGTVWNSTAIRTIMDLHAIMVTKGDGAKKIWVTEYGATTTSSYTEDMQSALITSSLQSWNEISYAGPFFIYTVRDGSNDGWGSVTTAFQPKKALWGVQALQSAGMPPRSEAQAFASNRDAALGAPLSVVYSMGGGYAQEFENGTRWATNNGWFSSPAPVATLIRAAQLVPLGGFVNGRQDLDTPGGCAIFYSAATGAHAIYGAILSSWTSALGLATSDQSPTGTSGAVAATFEHGRIVWSPTTGTTVTKS